MTPRYSIAGHSGSDRLMLYLYSDIIEPYFHIGGNTFVYDVYLHLKVISKKICLAKYHSKSFRKTLPRHKRIPNLDWFEIMLHCEPNSGGLAFLNEPVWVWYNRMPPKWQQRTQVRVKRWLLENYKIKLDMKKFFRGGIANARTA